MGRASNGMMKWLLTLLAAMLVALGGWSGRTLITHGERIAVVEGQHVDVQAWMDRIEKKLDRVLERR